MSPVHNLGLQVSVETSSGKTRLRLRFASRRSQTATDDSRAPRRVLPLQAGASTPRRRAWWDGTARGRSSPSWWRSSKSAKCAFARPAPPVGSAGSRIATGPRSRRTDPEAWPRQVSDRAFFLYDPRYFRSGPSVQRPLQSKSEAVLKSRKYKS